MLRILRSGILRSRLGRDGSCSLSLVGLDEDRRLLLGALPLLIGHRLERSDEPLEAVGAVVRRWQQLDVDVKVISVRVLAEAIKETALEGGRLTRRRRVKRFAAQLASRRVWPSREHVDRKRAAGQ